MTPIPGGCNNRLELEQVKPQATVISGVYLHGGIYFGGGEDVHILNIGL